MNQFKEKLDYLMICHLIQFWPDSDAETLAFFAEYLGRLSKTREDVKTWFEFGELDDYVSFKGKA